MSTATVQQVHVPLPAGSSKHWLKIWFGMPASMMLLDRFKHSGAGHAGERGEIEKAETEALLGGVEPPPVTVSEAFEIYCSKIDIGGLVNKSPAQQRLWRKTKNRDHW